MEEKQLAKQELNKDIMNKIVLKGDISGLSQDEKLTYYGAMCNRLGIDPLTQPFQILKLQGKEILYCTKGGAEQLTKLYGVSHEIKKRESVNEIYIVEVRASMWDSNSNSNRFVDEIGAVSVRGMSGDMLVNAMLKAVTKAKRRATLALLGLGMLDETEIETIPNANPVNIMGQEEIKEVTAKETKAAPTANKPTPMGDEGQKPSSNNCADCGTFIKSQIIAKKSIEEFGEPVCWNPENGGCQEKRRNQKAENEFEAEFSELKEDVI